MQENKKQKKGLILAILIIFALILLVLTGIYVFKGNHKIAVAKRNKADSSKAQSLGESASTFAAGQGDISNANIELSGGTTSISKSDDEINFGLKYSAQIRNFVGTGKVVMVITLPAGTTLDEANSSFDGVYNSNGNTITTTYNYGSINTTNASSGGGVITISHTKEYSLKFKEISKLAGSSITFQANGRLMLTPNNSSTETTAGQTNSVRLNTSINIYGTVQVIYREKKSGRSILNNDSITGFVGRSFDVTNKKKSIDGYTCIQEPLEKTGRFTEEEQSKEYIYAKNAKVIVNYIDTDTKEVLDSETIIGYEGKRIETAPKDIDHYTYANKKTSTNNVDEMTPETITITYHYTKTKYKYTVEYYYEDKETVIDTKESTFGVKIDTFIPKPITGYDNTSIAVPSSGDNSLPLTISDDETKNVIKVYYTKNTYQYSIKYHYDGILGETVNKRTKFGALISSYEPKNKTGYKYINDSGPIIVSEEPLNNVINVYYERDNFDYTIKYIYEGNDNLTQIVTGQALYGTTITNFEPKLKPGYKLSKSSATSLTISEDSERNIAIINYEKIIYNYRIEYYYDNEIDENATVRNLQAKFEDEINTYPSGDRKGYEMKNIQNYPLRISDDKEKNVIRVYYERKTYNYKIEYYYDGIIDDSKTDYGSELYGEQIKEHANNIKKGYRLESRIKYPLTITTENTEEPVNNVMKICYVIDENQTKKLSYTVEYYKDDVKQDIDTQVEEIEVQVLQPDTMFVNASKINMTNKYVGYTFKQVNSGTLPIEVNDGDIIKVYYELNNLGIVKSELTKVSKVGEENSLTKSNDKVSYKLTYDLIIENYMGKGGVYLEDRLPYPIEESTALLDGGTYSPADNTIVWNIDLGNIHTYNDAGASAPKSIKVEKNITVKFLGIELEKDIMINNAKAALFLPSDNQITQTQAEVGTPINVDGQVEVKYLDKYTNKEIRESAINVGKVGTEYDVTKDRTDVEGYTLLEEPENKKGKYTEAKQEKIYYYAKNTQVHVTYVEKSTGKEIGTDVTIDGYQGLDYNTEQKEITHYTFVEATKNAKGQMGRDITEVIYYYELTKYTYTVEYYYEGKINDANTDVFEAPYGTSIEECEDKNITGYKLDRKESLPLIIGDNEAENVIRVYYVKDIYGYTVEYYYDGERDDKETVKGEGRYRSVVSRYPNKKRTGYKLEKTSKVPLTISEVDTENVMKIYYVKDNFEYRVEYYYDGVKDDQATEFAEAVYGSNVRTYISKAKAGYKLDTTNLPLKITEQEENNVIEVRYIKTDFDYIVEYYYDGMRDDKETEFMKATYEDKITEYEDKNRTGYKLEKTSKLPLVLSDNEEENIIKVYYVKDTFEYRIKYYYDGNINEENTETGTIEYGTVIEEYEDKNIFGYKLEKTVNYPMTITNEEEDNVIEVYYVVDPDNTKILNYTVEYYKDAMRQKEDTTIEEEVVQVLQPNTIRVKPETINVTNKYPGYEFKKINTEEVPTEVESGTVIKVYYELKVAEVTEGTLTKISSKEIASRKDTVTYTLTYEAIINNYIGRAGIYLEDRLPYEIDESSSKLDGGKYTRADNCINWEIDLGEINTFKTGENVPQKINVSKEITVLYKNVDLLKDTMINNAKIGLYLPAQNDITEDEADVTTQINVNGQVEVKYIDQNTNKEIAESVIKEEKVGNTFDVSGDKKDIEGYILLEEPLQKTGVYKESKQERKYYYAKKSKVNVRYVDKITDEEIAPKEVIDGYEGKQYSTNRKMIEHYTYVGDSKNTSGDMARENIEVVYYYKYNTKVIVQYIDKETDSVIKTTEKEGLEGDVYETIAKEIPGYILVEEPEDRIVTMRKEAIIVRYYYSRISEGVVEKHIDEITGEMLYEKLHEGKEGDSYVTSEREFEGYDLDETKAPTNKEGRFQVDLIEVKYYYKRRASVRVQYIDTISKEKIIDDVVIKGYEKDTYVAEQKEFEGYKLVKKPLNAEGEMEVTIDNDGMYETEILVKFYYIRISEGVIERHIDIVSGKVLSETKHEGFEGDEYTTEEKEFIGYQLVKDKYPENKSGKMKPELIEVNYYYVRKAQIIVQCINKYTGDIISAETIDGIEEQEFKLEPKTLENYDFIESEGELQGKFEVENTKVIKFYYSRLAKVTVKYIEKETNKQIADEVIQAGYEGEEYITSAKEIPNMKLVEIPKNSTGVMVGEVNVIYYYRKSKFDMSISKSVKSLKVNGNYKKVSGDDMIKVETSKNKNSKLEFEIEYSIRVKNIGEIEGKANILEKIASGFAMYGKENPGWKVRNNEARLQTSNIVPGETRIYIIKLHWISGNSNLGLKVSEASIESTENAAGLQDANSSNNKSKAEMLVSVGTGAGKISAIVIIALSYILTIIYVNKKLTFKTEEIKENDNE